MAPCHHALAGFEWVPPKAVPAPPPVAQHIIKPMKIQPGPYDDNTSPTMRTAQDNVLQTPPFEDRRISAPAYDGSYPQDLRPADRVAPQAQFAPQTRNSQALEPQSLAQPPARLTARIEHDQRSFPEYHDVIRDDSNPVLINPYPNVEQRIWDDSAPHAQNHSHSGYHPQQKTLRQSQTNQSQPQALRLPPTNRDLLPPSQIASSAPASLIERPVASDIQKSQGQGQAVNTAPVNFGVVEGFGSDIPLSLALGQIIPSGFSHFLGDGVNPDQLVSWQGGQPWNMVLDEIALSSGLQARVQNNMVLLEKL